MSIKFDLDFVKEYVLQNNYKYLCCENDEYINTKSRIVLKCPNGHEYHTTFGDFRKGKRCKKCQKHSYDYVKNYISKFGYKLLSDDYIGCNHKLKIMCDKGHEYEATFHKFKNGKRRCPICKGIKLSKMQRKDFNDVINMFKKYNYKVLSDEKDFINTHKKLKVMCPSGHEYSVTPANFLTGYRCPICAMSTGEKTIFNILNMYNINFKTQYTFNDLKSDKGAYLKFDFAILNNDNKPIYIIEFDGLQHYEYIDYFYNNMEEFDRRILNDKIKSDYCKKNNIPLLRILYNQINDIKNILISNKIIPCQA